MPSPTQPEGQSQGPSSPGPVSSESNHLSCSEGKERHWSEQNAGSHHWVTSPKLENCSTKKCDNSMRLEDVPSLIETKGGLDSLSKVEQLVVLMQKVHNDNTKKSPDGIRQWLKVASVIAATEQGNCLNHFIRMGGLNPLDEWLQDAYKGKLCEDDTSKDEFITELLNALETLPIDGDTLKACGIKKSVKHLKNHKSPDIQRKAENLVHYWKKRVNIEKAVLNEPGETKNDLVHTDFDQSGLVQEGAKFRCAKPVGSAIVGGFCGKADKSSGSDVQQNGLEVQQNGVPVSSDVLCLEMEKDVHAVSQQASLGVKEAGSANLNEVVTEELVSKPNHLDSVSNKCCIDGEEASHHSADIAQTGMHSCAEIREENTKPGESESEPPQSMEFDDGGLRGNSGVHVGEQMNTVCVSKAKDEHIFKELQPGLVGSTATLHQEMSNHSLSDKLKVPLHPDTGSLKGINGDLVVAFHTDDKSKTSEPSQKKGFQITDSGSICTSIMSSINSSFSDRQPNIQALKLIDGTANWTGFIEPTPACGIGKGCDTGNGNFVSEASGASYSAGIQEDTETSNGDRTFRKNSARDTGLFNESVSRINMEETSPRQDEKKLEEDVGMDEELDLHFGEDDALEVARQVGKEAEQEVESYDEPLCSSSSESHLKEAPVHSTTTDSVGGEVVEQDAEVDLEVQSKKDDNLKGKCASEEIDISDTHANVVMKEQESYKITITSQESITHETQATTNNSNDQIQTPVRCIIDLNEDVPEEDEFSEERVHAPTVATTSASNCTITNVSTPIPVVGSSKGPFNLPASLHFRGELGWRGSAATSAFRPAEPRRTPERDRTQSGEENNSPLKTQSAEENNSSVKPGKRIFEIDLNVADDDGDAVMDLFSRGHDGERHVPASACLPSGDSSVEVSSSRRADRLTLDLNRLCETDDSGPGLHADWRDFNVLGALQKPNRSPSPTSSSRPGRRNFDLNDNPTLDDVCASAHDSEQKRYNIKSNNNHPGLDDPVVSILGSRIDLDHTKLPPVHASSFIAPWDYSNARKDLPNSAEPFLVSAPNAVSSLNQMGRMLPMPSVTYQQPPLSFPYNGVALGSFPVTSTVYGPGHLPYMVESMGGTITQMVGPPTISSSFTRPPYLMGSTSGVGATNSNGIGRPNLDLNSGVSPAEIDSREAGIKMRHFFPQGNDQRPFQQVASSAPHLKRKEPECGWESYQVGYKQPTQWR